MPDPATPITLISVLVGAIRLALGAGVDDEQLAICVDAAKAIVNAPDVEAEQALFDEAISKLGVKYP